MPKLKTPPLRPTKFIEKTDWVPRDFVVACVWWGAKYPIEYVHNLARACAHYLSPHEFHVITDRDRDGEEWRELTRTGLIARPIQTEWKGWWNKIQLFKPNQFYAGQRILFLDLDVVITRELDCLVNTLDEFVMIENFGPNRSHAAYNSSAMLWTAGNDTRAIWEEFDPAAMDQLHGDQCWIWRCMDSRGISCWPREWVASYKYDIRGKPQKERDQWPPLIVFHGPPKPPATEWRDVWSGKFL